MDDAMHVADDLTRLIEAAIDTACKYKWNARLQTCLAIARQRSWANTWSALHQRTAQNLCGRMLGSAPIGKEAATSISYVTSDERRDISLNAYSAWTQG